MSKKNKKSSPQKVQEEKPRVDRMALIREARQKRQQDEELDIKDALEFLDNEIITANKEFDDKIAVFKKKQNAKSNWQMLFNKHKKTKKQKSKSIKSKSIKSKSIKSSSLIFGFSHDDNKFGFSKSPKSAQHQVQPDEGGRGRRRTRRHRYKKFRHTRRKLF